MSHRICCFEQCTFCHIMRLTFKYYDNTLKNKNKEEKVGLTELLQNMGDSWRNKGECDLAHLLFQPARFLKPRLIRINDINFRTAQSSPNKTNSSQREDSKGINSVLVRVKSWRFQIFASQGLWLCFLILCFFHLPGLSILHLSTAGVENSFKWA